MPLTKLHTQKCRGCGHFQTPEEGHECNSCGAHDKWGFFCEEHKKTFDTPMCTFCEEAALQRREEERAYRAEQERRRREAEEAEKRRREFELEQQRKRREQEERRRKVLEEHERRQAQFLRATKVSGLVALTASLLCFLFTLQLFTHGEFILPFSEAIIYLLLSIATAAGLSVFLIAVFFDLFILP